MAAAKQGAASTATGGGDDPAAAHRPLSLAAGIPLSIGGVALVAGATGMLPGRPGVSVTSRFGATENIRDRVVRGATRKIAEQIQADAKSGTEKNSYSPKLGLGVDALLSPEEYDQLVQRHSRTLEAFDLQRNQLKLMLGEGKVEESHYDNRIREIQQEEKAAYDRLERQVADRARGRI